MSLTVTILNSSLDQKVPAFANLADYEVRESLIAQLVRSELMNLRAGNAHTKTRAEVRGGGRKPWKQKGTGRARHGSTRSPIWVGGGVSHGPRSTRNWHLKINKSSRIAGLKSILKDRLDNNVVYILPAGFDFAQTKTAIPVVASIRPSDVKTDKQTTLIYTSADKDAIRGFMNTEIKMMNIDQVKIVTLVNSRNVILTPQAKEALEAKLA
jgi:large subunit ribosomal protein L4